ncbi:cytochrome P450 99A2-like [Hordeum vulgare subsp. vulgare]|uniref:cytochrome P450 99A2-like n=1 Tax=Hordeum vulgare subsp. vulgare TaxID=112509 RepID=UPI001D1A4A91|nr:cytochrome P450 99A2-like [Hordeum vulgare subsp. vulgare]
MVMMMEQSAATLMLLTLASLVVLASVLSRKPKNHRRPPGPWRLPLIGSLHHVLTSQPQVALRDLAKKHGPVMYLRFGQMDTVVVSSPAAAQEVLRDKDLSFASRPNILVSEIFCYGGRNVILAPYGPYWRMTRKLCTVELLSERKVRQFAPFRDSETMSLVENIRAAGQGGASLNLGKLLISCTNTITAKATFGQVCDEELQDRFMAVTGLAIKASGGSSVGDLVPSLWFVDALTGLRGRLWRARRQLDAILDKIIADERREGRRGDHLLGVLLRIKDEGNLEFPIDMTNIKAIILDMFTAGTETTSAVAEWVMAELIRNPKVMAKAQAEVRRTLDTKNPIDHEEYIDDLHYTKMVIKETMRLNPVVPLLVPHLCQETCDVGGFEVKEGTRVLVNAWAMARSPEYWENAEEFMPERFEDGTATYKGSRFEYLPFGTGRRKCPGDTFGLATLELAVTRLLYYFDWSLPAGTRVDELDMETSVGIATRRKNQLHLVATPYKCAC